MPTARFLLPLLCALAPLAQDGSEPQTLPGLGWTVTPPKLANITFDGTVAGQVHARWKGSLDGVDVEITLYVLPGKEFGLDEPSDVVDVALFNLKNPKHGGQPSFKWDALKLVTGAFGYVQYAQIARGTLKNGTQNIGTLFVLGALLKDSGCWLEARLKPEPTDAQIKTIQTFLETGIVYKGDKRDPKWTDEDAKARWAREAPEAAKKKPIVPMRTDHYIILTDSSGGKKFAEAMEKAYAAVKKIFPFEDTPGQQLMPVFLFRTPDEYYDFYMNIAKISHDAAARSKGHAWRDYYATWYEAPADPVHIHEGTHQIFANRLSLSGGGSWFQEGVAEYVCTQKNDRNTAASQVKKNKHVPLAEFIQVEALIAGEDDKSGESKARAQYLEAAMLIEFLRESDFGKAKFLEFVHSVGGVRRNDAGAIEKAIRSVYGVDLKGLEKEWIEYCMKR